MRKVLIDSNLYIDFLRTGQFADSITALYLFRKGDIYFSSVVASELFQGALDAKGKKNVETLLRPFEKVGRIVTPAHQDWREAGSLLSEIRRKRKDLSTSIPRLLHDTLLALSAKRIGATLYSANKKDFELIAHFKNFQFQVIESSS